MNCSPDGSLCPAQLLDELKRRKEMAPVREELMWAAREAAALPPVLRAYTLDQVGQNRTFRDDRLLALEEDIRETYALAISDMNQLLTQELPLLAAAYRLSGEEAFRLRVVAQLEEMATWSPLQRPGWTLFAPGKRLPPDGNDGCWLATGLSIRTIADALELMPEGSLENSLIARLHSLLGSEVERIVDDWKTRRSWFIRTNNAVTNQWVLPTEGLIRACLLLGREQNPDAYQMGVSNMLQSLESHGANGEFEEGIQYAAVTVTSMLSAARAMAVAGDNRCLGHPFLQRFPLWMVHHLQPGRFLINCFDTFESKSFRDGGNVHDYFRILLGVLAACTAHPLALWTLRHQFDDPANDLPGFLARTLLRGDSSSGKGSESAPPLFASYERATRVNWRDGWEDAASGFWMRGGHPLDQHDHQDRGHVSFISEGRPVLIEAGTPAYHDSMLPTHYASCCGHNVLQLGEAMPGSVAEEDARAQRSGSATGSIVPGWQKSGGVAPLSIARLNPSGGEATVDATLCYDGLRRWQRHVKWRSTQLRVEDAVELENGESDFMIFRWHLGTREKPAVRGGSRAYELRWREAEMAITASTDIEVSLVDMPDHTLDPRDWSNDSSGALHTCVVVRSCRKLSSLQITTIVIPQF